jgi:hypothetical protein
MLLSHQSTAYMQPLPPIATGPPFFHSNPHHSSVSVASIAHLTSSHVTPVPTTHNRLSSTPRQEYKEEWKGSGSSGPFSHEEDELEENEDDDFLAHQTSAPSAGKRKGKAR